MKKTVFLLGVVFGAMHGISNELKDIKVIQGLWYDDIILTFTARPRALYIPVCGEKNVSSFALNLVGARATSKMLKKATIYTTSDYSLRFNRCSYPYSGLQMTLTYAPCITKVSHEAYYNDPDKSLLLRLFKKAPQAALGRLAQKRSIV